MVEAILALCQVMDYSRRGPESYEPEGGFHAEEFGLMELLTACRECLWGRRRRREG